MKSLLILLLIPLLGAAQSKEQAEKAAQTEQQELNQALAEAGNSPVDFIRALEKHLAKYPNSPQKNSILRGLFKAANDAKDDARTVRYGEQVLAATPDDLQVLDVVTRLLLNNEDRESATRALGHALHYQLGVEALAKQPPTSGYTAVQWQQQVEKALSRAYLYEARAAGNQGRNADALTLAQRSWDTYPTAAGARELGRWLSRSGREMEAVEHIADAFTMEDPLSTEADRGKDRIRMGELYQKVNGSEKGLGDLVLKAYDRTSALMSERLAHLQSQDPNVKATNILDFTLPGVTGGSLSLASLKGKTIVFDFWATWCGPCRAQHPLYEKVKEHFKNNANVVFLAIATDEDRALVSPFLKERGWSADKVYFEAGMSRTLDISSIPTTIIVGKDGNIASRMNGFVPERFVDLLTQRIQQALN